MAAAVNLNLGTLLTNTYATPPVLNATGEDLCYLYVKQATCAIPTTGTDLANSVYAMCRVFSSDIPNSIMFSSTALTAGALSIGLFLPDTKTVAATNSDHLFATSINCASAVAYTEERFTNKDVTTTGQKIWQLLGLSSDPLAYYDLSCYSTTGATAAGTLGLIYKFTR
jgi:hypothetical protein